uniref:Uncharacterized protein n=1 Tax=Romanomermis culicivorax TaxID=13658 RepID=A0A915J1L2_ROMCU
MIQKPWKKIYDFHVNDRIMALWKNIINVTYHDITPLVNFDRQISMTLDPFRKARNCNFGIYFYLKRTLLKNSITPKKQSIISPSRGDRPVSCWNEMGKKLALAVIDLKTPAESQLILSIFTLPQLIKVTLSPFFSVLASSISTYTADDVHRKPLTSPVSKERLRLSFKGSTCPGPALGIGVVKPHNKFPV